jgi:predicted nucleic acid-binding protein
MDRIYVDTSVFGGYFEPEFEFWSKQLFDSITKGEIKMLYSQMAEIELEKAPKRVRDVLLKIPVEHIEFLPITEQSTSLADKYISENVVGKTSRPDCIHIAIATLNNADILASWNFKHIVNVTRIKGYNGVNKLLGHPHLEIRTPREILEI